MDENSNNNHSKSECISTALSDTYCHLCNAKFNSRENYYAHLHCTHSTFQKQFSQTSLSQLALRKRQQEKNDDSILNEYALIERIIWCEKCKCTFDTMALYLQHYSFHHCSRTVKCLQCSDVFDTMELFFKHVERIHPSKTGKYIFLCFYCIIIRSSFFLSSRNI